MKKSRFLVLLAILTVIISCSTQEQFTVGEKYHGFTLVEKKFVEEVNADCYLFKHDKSGAHLLKIAADDPNKMFNIAFKTVPETNYGTPHILEHSVLNGSKNFPVKSPFDELRKGSLNTFLNAMTGSDITTYPVASMNEKDYFNLMHVYLDAVLYPMIYEDPRILKQEGWHYEMDSINSDITYKGVVYNEMKGVFSDPESEMYFQMSKMLFPDNTYGVESGGYPTDIPKLTYDYFINFHKKFYHPGNSYIYLYGDADMNKELDFIDSEYLSKYDLPKEKIEIPLQKPFEAMKEEVKNYPVADDAPTEDQTFLNLAFVIGQSNDRALAMSFDVISEALVNNESAPLRLALQKAGIGKDVSAYFSEDKQCSFRITVQNANPEDKDTFKEIVFNTLQSVVDSGFDKSVLEGIINRTEFRLKEGNTPQKGLMYTWQSYQQWFFADDPFLGLEFNKPLAETKKALSTDLLENAIKTHLMNNPHSALLVLKPEPGLQAKLDEATKNELIAYKNSLTTDQKDQLVKETNDLKEYQKREDSPEALATIPMLELSDISPEIQWYGVDEKKVSDINVIHHNTFTNNILYSYLYFDLRTLPQELIPYTELLSNLLGKLNTENYTYGDLENAMNINTGGFYTYNTTFLEKHDDNNLIPKYVVYGKSTAEKAVNLFELTNEVLSNSIYNDKDRLKELISRHQSQVDANIKNNGIGYALTRLTSYYSNSGMFSELTGGIEYYNFITDLSDNFDTKSDEIIANLEKTASLLFAKDNVIAAITCDDKDFDSYSEGLNTLASSLPNNESALNNWTFDFSIKNEGLKTTSKVQYVVQGYNYKKLGYNYDGKLKVLKQILSTDYLQKQVRVLGGAYGGFCNFSNSGNVYFASYRDPNLKETLENYTNTTEFLDTFDADSLAMTRFIIGTIGSMDNPMTPSQKGSEAIRNYFEKNTPEELKAERAAVLSTTKEDIKEMEKMVKDILDQDAIFVYGNEQKVEENADLFGEVISIKE